MIDFSKKINSAKIIKEIDPMLIYNSLDRQSTVGPLRQTQELILNEWNRSRRNDKDLIIKLHTGEGKTLIGLLILLSKLNETSKPVVYLCPNKNLVNQTIGEAEKFGIPFCKIETDNKFPTGFLDGSKILITNVQKFFNGKSIFGLNAKSKEIESIVLDDSHACIDSITNSFSIIIGKDEKLYEYLKNLFADDLKQQGEGSFLDLDNESSQVIMPIPYWSWINKKSDLLRRFADNIKQSEGRNASLFFAWDILKDNIDKCWGFISPTKIEIFPMFNPVRFFESFSKANNRILMSATTQNDSFFIKNFNFSRDSIRNPLIDRARKYSGEKMILIPSLISDLMERDVFVQKIAKLKELKIKIVSIVPSFQRANFYNALGLDIAKDNDNLERILRELKDDNLASKCKVIVNRYDGIDLPDSTCRILILDSLPYSSSLFTSYEEIARPQSEVINIITAQKIEQGLGRSVRGEKDYSVIILLGADLVEFIKSSKTKKYFSLQTQAQVHIGLEIAKSSRDNFKNNIEDLEEESKRDFKEIFSIINQCISRDEGWKEYYTQQMNSLINSINENVILDDLILKEKEAENLFFNNEFEEASRVISELISENNLNESDKGWYLQLKAYYLYCKSVTESISTQICAYKKNKNLLKPSSGINYEKLEINEDRVSNIKKNFNNGYDELILKTERILSNISFGVSADTFEKSLMDLGIILGFGSQRPDKEIRVGPDNLWCSSSGNYILFECKSEVVMNRTGISKREAGQFEQHLKWFSSVYGTSDSINILIFPKNNLERDAFLPAHSRIMTDKELTLLKQNVKNFISEFSKYKIEDLTYDKITEWISVHHLNKQDFCNIYSVQIKRNTSN